MFIEATGRDSLVFLQLRWLVVFGMFVRMHQNMLDLNPTQSEVANPGLFGFPTKNVIFLVVTGILGGI